MRDKQSQAERFSLLVAFFRQRMRLFFLLIAIVLPFAFVWFNLFLELLGSALLVPLALFLHEWLHMVFFPPSICVRLVNTNFVVAVDFAGKISARRGLLIALAPHVVMWGLALFLWKKTPLLALPFGLSGLSLLADLWTWYRRIFHG